MSAFGRATAVRADGEHRWRAEVDPGWGAPTGPNGGYLAAIAARALEADVNPGGDRRLRSLTCHYLRPAAGGEMAVEVETLRAGRRVASARFVAFQEGKEILTGLAAFAAPGLEGAGEWSPSLPAVAGPPAHDAVAVDSVAYRPDGTAWLTPPEDQAPPIVSKVHGAPVIGGWPFSGSEPELGRSVENGAWIELPEAEPLDSSLVALLTDVWVPPAFSPLTSPAIAPTIDLTIHIRADLGATGLPAQPVLGHYATSTAHDGLIEEDGRLFLRDGSLLAHSRQLALLAPVASRSRV